MAPGAATRTEEDVPMKRAILATSAVVAVGGAAARWRWHDWGATPEEKARRYPGDDLVPEPTDAVTRAVAVDAPPEAVWPWLVQIGQDRGGMYSYDWLENLFGLDIHSTDELRAEWQSLKAGDRVVVVPPGMFGMPDGYAFPVAEVEPNHHLVLRQSPPEHPWNAVWTFVLEPDGDGRCRLVSRSRSTRPTGGAAMPLRVATAMMDPVTLLMTRRMLLGIKERAERSLAS